MRDRLSHVFVTGGTSGIGRATVLRLAALGTKVTFTGRSRERAADVIAAAAAAGGEVCFIEADLRVPGAPERAVGEAVAKLGPLDAAVNAAAGSLGGGLRRLHELEDRAYEEQLVSELRIVVGSLRGELAHACSRERRPLSIVTVSSINGLGASPRAPFYSALKAAEMALTKNAALDYAPEGVRVNTVVLGAFETPMLAHAHASLSGGDPAVAAAIRERLVGFVPLARVGAPEEAAAAIVWLCSSESSYVTGTSFIVDGGITAFAR